MKHVAVITARGGSKRIPGKNIKDFCGQPIIAYSIRAALDSGLYDEVMVSTDSEEIAAIARQYGAAVPFMRSAATANDYATTRDVLLEVLAEYEKRGRTFDALTCLYPCNPFITAEKLQKAVEIIETTDANRVIPTVEYPYPPQRAFVEKDGYITYQYPEYLNTRTQDLTPIFHDCGQFYVFRVSDLLAPSQTMDKWVPLMMPPTEVQDIDTDNDWKIAEIKYRLFIENK